jgi:hypothetical protein
MLVRRLIQTNTYWVSLGITVRIARSTYMAILTAKPKEITLEFLYKP